MSLFLGKIHYWLYDKIIWSERLEQDIIELANKEGLKGDKLAEEAVSKFGESTQNKPLEDVIDTDNIHGWLQDKITKVELRQAYIITAILEASPDQKDNIIKIFENQGKKIAEDYKGDINIPEDAFSALNDFIVEGMPCDRVNEVVSSDAHKYSWRTTTCLHKSYWDQVGGDISIFYTLRDTWVKAFIEGLDKGFKYTKIEDSVHEISVK